MLKKIPRIITFHVAKLNIFQFPPMAPTRHDLYLFSTQRQQQAKPNKEQQDAERIRKQQEIQFRKRTMEDIELKNIRDKIQNTKGNYNPTFAYLKLYSNHFQIAIFLGCLCILITVFLTSLGIYTDPLTNKKKIVLISDKFQKSMDKHLRDIMFTQLCGTLTPNDTLSNNLKGKLQEIEEYVKEKTKISYKIVVISSQQHILNILPNSIVLSKNIFTLPSCEIEDLKRFILTMQRLFSQKLHIKQLALSNIPMFLMAKIKSNVTIDLKLSSIYSRKYTLNQLNTALKQVSLLYKDPQDRLKQSCEKVLKALSSQLYKQQSKFSLLNRFQSLINREIQ